MVFFRRGPGALSWLVFTWILPALVTAGIVNRTIDDSFGDSQTGLQVVYLPGVGVWDDETCIGCSIKPNVANAFKRTYTAATYNPGLDSINITMQFNGTAIYVFFILANNAGDGITTLTEANFTLDGTTPTLFTHAPDLTTTAFDFNQLVFQKTDLINAQHTLVISTSGVNTNVFVNFDYAIYTHDDDAPLLPLPGSTVPSTSPPATTTTTTASSPNTTSKVTTTATRNQTASPTPTDTAVENTSITKSKTPTGAIAGGIIAAVLVVALILFLIWYFRRRRNQQFNTQDGYVPPLMTEMDPEIDRQGGTVIPLPFVQPSPAPSTGYTGYTSGSAFAPAASTSRSSMPLSYDNRSPLSQADFESAYGGYVDPNVSSQQASSGSNITPSNSDAASYYQGGPRRGPLVSVTAGDHMSTPDTIEAIRIARQNELDQRLRTVQEEMWYLTSDLNSGEKSARRSIRHRTINRGRSRTGSEGTEVVEEELSMSDMREQLRLMREQIAYLQDQQRSAWAQGLSDDPPPGYTPESSTRYSGPPPTVQGFQS